MSILDKATREIEIECSEDQGDLIKDRMVISKLCKGKVIIMEHNMISTNLENLNIKERKTIDV